MWCFTAQHLINYLELHLLSKITRVLCCQRTFQCCSVWSVVGASKSRQSDRNEHHQQTRDDVVVLASLCTIITDTSSVIATVIHQSLTASPIDRLQWIVLVLDHFTCTDAVYSYALPDVIKLWALLNVTVDQYSDILSPSIFFLKSWKFPVDNSPGWGVDSHKAKQSCIRWRYTRVRHLMNTTEQSKMTVSLSLL